MPDQISSPLRILVLSTPSTPLPPLLQDSILPITTPYYTAQVPVWHDTIKSSAVELREWDKEWRDEEAAGEVVRAVGAWVVVVKKPVLGSGEGDLTQIRQILTTIFALLTHHTSSSFAPDPNPDPLLLVVSMHQPLSPRLEFSDEDWDDLGRECGGWEWVDGEKEGEVGGRNEFGEKTGLSRLLEALEANDWTTTSASTSPSPSPSSPSPFPLNRSRSHSRSRPATTQLGTETEGPGADDMLWMEIGSESQEPLFAGGGGGGGKELDEGDVEEEGRGRNGDEDDEKQEKPESQLDNLDALMSKMLAIRDQSAEMPETERRRFAARAVRGIMRDL